jgi:hypothetical protein
MHATSNQGTPMPWPALIWPYMSHLLVRTFLDKNCEQNYICGESETVNPRYYMGSYNVNWYHSTIQS